MRVVLLQNSRRATKLYDNAVLTRSNLMMNRWMALPWMLILTWPAHGGQKPIDFRTDIEPILREHCLRCHGPEKRKGGLLLTSRKNSLAPADSGHAAIVPGNAAKSELIQRVATMNKDERMPPTGPPLTAA